MNIKNCKRCVNKNLISALIAYNGLNLTTLGLKCNPPVSRACMCMLINGKNFSDRLIEQVSDVLHVPTEILFPYVSDGKITEQKIISKCKKESYELIQIVALLVCILEYMGGLSTE